MKISYKHSVFFVVIGFVFLACFSNYNNVTSFFNTYYNAKNIFKEAVREVEKLPQKDRDTNYFRIYAIPKSTAGKFEKVIEKCSKIIQLYPQSSYIDRSLVMIGRSYIYRGETESAIRKFREFLENFPSSPLRLEAKMGLSIALYQSGKSDEAIQIIHDFVPESESEGEENILLTGILLEGQIMIDREEYESAIEIFNRGLKVDADDELLARLHSSRALCYERLNKNEDAAEAYRLLSNYTNDINRGFLARLKRGKALVASGNYDTAFEIFKTMSGERLKNEERGLVELERAKTYMIIGDTIKAFEIFEQIDSTYKKTDAAAKAYYERGLMYDKYYADYNKAKFYYEKAKTEFPASEINPIVQKKLNTLNKYFRLKENLNKIDSLLTLAEKRPRNDEDKDSTIISDTTRNESENVVTDTIKFSSPEIRDTIPLAINELSINDVAEEDSVLDSEEDSKIPPSDTLSLVETVPDTIMNPLSPDSLDLKPDTMKAKKGIVKNEIKQKIPVDSLKLVKAKNIYEVASIFFLDLNQYDSALTWYKLLIDEYPASSLIPRSLYAISEIERSRGDTVAVDSIYSIILTQHDSTEYARKIKMDKGLINVNPEEDPAEKQFRDSELLLISKDTTGAIRSYMKVVDDYPESPTAAKALYTLGWLMENIYSLNDSAYFWYKRLVTEYPSSPYASVAKPKVVVKENPEKLSEFVKINEIKPVPLVSKQSQEESFEIPEDEEQQGLEEGRQNRKNVQPDEEEEEEEEPEEDDEEPGID